MKGLREKFRNNKGFTLVEMLIVVAIIAILIAVSIPLVSNSLEKARSATDAANVRAAKAEMTILYLNEKVKLNDVRAYDAAAGKIVTQTEASNITPYGKADGNTNNIVWVYLQSDGTMSYQWNTKSTYSTGTGAWKTDIPVVS